MCECENRICRRLGSVVLAWVLCLRETVAMAVQDSKFAAIARANEVIKS